MRQVLVPPKKQGDAIFVSFNFFDQMVFGEVLSAPVVVATLFAGLDSAPSTIISGAATVNGSIVQQKVVGGMAGVTYLLTATVNGGSGRVYKVTQLVSVLSQTGFASDSIVTLTGTLPNGIVGAPYSSNLVIAGGYLPYTPVGLIAGAPPWMGYTVVSDQLVCAGTPDEAAAITYNFSPTIQDAALTLASAPQTVNITRIIASGNVPDAGLGAFISYSYTADFGTPPYTFALGGGALQPGWALASSGLVEGIATGSGGTNNWKVIATDVNGVTDDLDDSNTIGPFPWLYVVACSAASAHPPIVSKQGGDSGTYATIPVMPSPTSNSSEMGMQFVHGVMFYLGTQVAAFCNRQYAEPGSTWEPLNGYNNNFSGRIREILWIPNLGKWLATVRNSGGTAFLYSSDAKNWSDGPTLGTSGPAALLTKKKGTNVVIGTVSNRDICISADNSLNWSRYTESQLNAAATVDCILGVASGFLLFGTDPGGNLIVLRSATGQTGSWTVVPGTPPTTQRVRFGCVLDYANDIVGVVFFNAVSSIITGFGATFGFVATGAGTNGSTNSALVQDTSRMCMCGRVVSPGVYEMFTFATIGPSNQHIYRYRSGPNTWVSLGAYGFADNPSQIFLLRDKDMQE